MAFAERRTGGQDAGATTTGRMPTGAWPQGPALAREVQP